MHLSGPESLILESDWLIARAPAVRMFPSGPSLRTATDFPAFTSFPAVFSLQRTLNVNNEIRNKQLWIQITTAIIFLNVKRTRTPG